MVFEGDASGNDSKQGRRSTRTSRSESTETHQQSTVRPVVMPHTTNSCIRENQDTTMIRKHAQQHGFAARETACLTEADSATKVWVGEGSTRVDSGPLHGSSSRSHNEQSASCGESWDKHESGSGGARSSAHDDQHETNRKRNAPAERHFDGRERAEEVRVAAADEVRVARAARRRDRVERPAAGHRVHLASIHFAAAALIAAAAAVAFAGVVAALIAVSGGMRLLAVSDALRRESAAVLVQRSRAATTKRN